MDKQKIVQICLGVCIVGVGGFWLFADADAGSKKPATNPQPKEPKTEVQEQINADVVMQHQNAQEREPGEVLGEMPVDPNINIKTNKKRLIPEQPTVKTESKPDKQQPQKKEPVTQQDKIQEEDPQPKPQKTITEDQLKSEEPQPKQQEIPEKEDDDSEIKALIDHIQKLEAERDAAKQEKQNIAAAKKERESQQKELDLLKKQIAQLEKTTTTKDKTNKLLKEQLAKLEELAAKKEPVKVTNNHITLNIQPVNDLAENSVEEFLTDNESSDIVADLNDLEDGETLEITDEDDAIIFVFTKVGDNIEVEQATSGEDEQESEDEEADATEDQEIEEDAVID